MPLAHRVMIPELMDDPAIDAARHDAALRDLTRINHWSRSADILWPALKEACHAAGSLSVLDVAAGAGDVVIELARRAESENLGITFDACDISPHALRHAERACAESRLRRPIHFFPHDVLGTPLPGTYDAVICSLFLHHVPGERVPYFLNNLATAARRLVLVNDLERSRLGLALAWLGTRVLSRSPIVHTDGPRSVRAAFTLDEASQAAEAAGMRGARGERHWPCRFLLRWDRP